MIDNTGVQAAVMDRLAYYKVIKLLNKGSYLHPNRDPLCGYLSKVKSSLKSCVTLFMPFLRSANQIHTSIQLFLTQVWLHMILQNFRFPSPPPTSIVRCSLGPWLPQSLIDSWLSEQRHSSGNIPPVPLIALLFIPTVLSFMLLAFSRDLTFRFFSQPKKIQFSQLKDPVPPNLS